MAELEVCLEHWPIFITIAPPELEEEPLERYIQLVDSLYARGERFATLVSTSSIERLPSAKIRTRLASWQNDTIAQIKRYNVCTATEIKSPIARGMMTAMHWIFRPPNEQRMVDSFASGYEFTRARLAEERVPFSAGLRAWADAGRVPTVAEVRGRVAPDGSPISAPFSLAI